MNKVIANLRDLAAGLAEAVVTYFVLILWMNLITMLFSKQ